MPRYFFDVHDDLDIYDEEGMVLPDLDAARAEATTGLAEIGRDLLPRSGPQKTLRIVVRDECDQPLLEVSLEYAARQLAGLASR